MGNNRHFISSLKQKLEAKSMFRSLDESNLSDTHMACLKRLCGLVCKLLKSADSLESTWYCGSRVRPDISPCQVLYHSIIEQRAV